MQSALVVVAFDEFLHALPQVFEIAVCSAVNDFTFQCFEKTFACGVVIQVRRSAHAHRFYWSVELPSPLSCSLRSSRQRAGSSSFFNQKQNQSTFPWWDVNRSQGLTSKRVPSGK